MNMNPSLWTYLRHDKKSIQGWLQRTDAEIIGALLEFQQRDSIAGACVEIGVHHGKSFIPLCMSLAANEKAMCIDLFDEQGKNLDSSGKGDRRHFDENLGKFGIDASRVCVFKGSSEDVSADHVLGQVGPVRYFSVDGGHWKSIVMNDLRLAEKTLSPGGIIALDDYCRAEWPDVTAGYAVWQDATASDIIPFAIGSNKLFLCRRPFAEPYRAALRTPFLSHYLSSTYNSNIGMVDSYRVEFVDQDEERTTKALGRALKICQPDFFMSFLKGFGRPVR